MVSKLSSFRTKAATDDVITSNELMNNIPEEEIDQQQEKEQNISSPSSAPVEQSEIKNRCIAQEHALIREVPFLKRCPYFPLEMFHCIQYLLYVSSLKFS